MKKLEAQSKLGEDLDVVVGVVEMVVGSFPRGGWLILGFFFKIALVCRIKKKVLARSEHPKNWGSFVA